jgi:hypothetical protein
MPDAVIAIRRLAEKQLDARPIGTKYRWQEL